MIYLHFSCLSFPSIWYFLEKRTGILKPQGSLEKSRERDVGGTENGGLTVGNGRKGGRQNIAMQTILRKGVTLTSETEVKQV